MPSNYTPNYNLNQWDAADRIQRADFNADNAKIDAALAALAEGKGDASALAAAAATAQTALGLGQAAFSPDKMPWVTGMYVGTGTSGTVTINTGFPLAAIFLEEHQPHTPCADNFYILTRDMNEFVLYSRDTENVRYPSILTWSDDGLNMSSQAVGECNWNRKDYKYYYIAFRK